MKNKFSLWIEQYLFYPNLLQKFLSIVLLPLTLVYCVVVTFKKIGKTPIDFGILIIRKYDPILRGFFLVNSE